MLQELKLTRVRVLLPLPFDFDDDIFDEEAKNAHASRLTESTIDVNTGEKVAYQLENGVSMGKFVLFSLCLLFYF